MGNSFLSRIRTGDNGRQPAERARFGRAGCALAILPIVAFASLLSTGLSGQGAQSVPAKRPVTMTADGRPDIQGLWRGAGNAGGAAYDLERGMPDDERFLTSRP